MGCRFLPQGIFPTQGLNPGLLHCRQTLYRLSHQGSPHRKTAAAASKSLQSCPTLCDPIDGSPPGSSVHRILQARTLEWVAISFSRGSPNPGIKLESPMSPVWASGFFTTEPPGKIIISIATQSKKTFYGKTKRQIPSCMDTRCIPKAGLEDAAT